MNFFKVLENILDKKTPLYKTICFKQQTTVLLILKQNNKSDICIYIMLITIKQLKSNLHLIKSSLTLQF